MAQLGTGHPSCAGAPKNSELIVFDPVADVRNPMTNPKCCHVMPRSAAFALSHYHTLPLSPFECREKWGPKYPKMVQTKSIAFLSTILFPEIMFPPWFQQKLRSHKARPKNLARSLARYRRVWAKLLGPCSIIFFTNLAFFHGKNEV